MIVTLALFLLGFVLLVTGANWLVSGASRLAATAGIKPLVIGLTVVAFGTSAPELAVSLQSTFNGQPDIALGNVVGSNICNILLILGVAAVVSPLVVAQQLVRLDVPLMIGASVLLYLLSLDGHLGRLDGLVLFACMVAYLGFSVVQSRRENRAVEAEYSQAYGSAAKRPEHRPVARNLMLLAAGLIMLTLGARWLVAGAVAIAQWLGVSDLIIGLTVIAIGTSLPEIAASLVASWQGERDIAVGNAIGSNLFNILAVLGLTSMLSPNGITVAPSALHFDLPVMIAVAVACLPIFLSGHRLDRWEGALFIAYYGAYLLYLVLAATRHDALRVYNWVMAGFVLPLTVITLLVLAWRSLRRQP